MAKWTFKKRTKTWWKDVGKCASGFVFKSNDITGEYYYQAGTGKDGEDLDGTTTSLSKARKIVDKYMKTMCKATGRRKRRRSKR